MVRNKVIMYLNDLFRIKDLKDYSKNTVSDAGNIEKTRKSSQCIRS